MLRYARIISPNFVGSFEVLGLLPTFGNSKNRGLPLYWHSPPPSPY